MSHIFIYLGPSFSQIHVPTFVTDLCSLYLLPHLTGQADIPNLLLWTPRALCVLNL